MCFWKSAKFTVHVFQIPVCCSRFYVGSWSSSVSNSISSMSQNTMRLGNVSVDSSGAWTITGSGNYSRQSVQTRRENYVDRSDTAFDLEWNGDKYIIEIFCGLPVIGQAIPDNLQEVRDPKSMKTGKHLLVGRTWLFRVLYQQDPDELRCSGNLVMQVEMNILKAVQRGNWNFRYNWDLRQRRRPMLIAPDHITGFSAVYLAAVANMMLETSSEKVVPVPENYSIPNRTENQMNWLTETWIHVWYNVVFTQESVEHTMAHSYRLKIEGVIRTGEGLLWKEDKAETVYVMHNGGMIFQLKSTGSDLVGYYCGHSQSFCTRQADTVPWLLELNQPPKVMRDIRTDLLTGPEFFVLRRLLMMTPTHPTTLAQIKAKTYQGIHQVEEEPCGGIFGPEATWTGMFKRDFQLRKVKYFQTGFVAGPADMKRIGRRFVFVKSSRQYVWQISTCSGQFWARDSRSLLYYFIEHENGSLSFCPVRNKRTGEHYERMWDHEKQRFPPGMEPLEEDEEIDEDDSTCLLIHPDSEELDDDIFTTDEDEEAAVPAAVPAARIQIQVAKRRHSSRALGKKK